MTLWIQSWEISLGFSLDSKVLTFTELNSNYLENSKKLDVHRLAEQCNSVWNILIPLIAYCARINYFFPFFSFFLFFFLLSDRF